MARVFVLFAFARGEAADQTGHQQKKNTSVRCYCLIVTAEQHSGLKVNSREIKLIE